MNLAKLISSQQVGQKASSSNTENIVNQIMLSLKASKTGWRVGFKTENEVNLYKQELLKACIENKIDSIEKIEIGLAQARKDISDFFPSVGKFISWCLKSNDSWEHKGAAYQEFRPERLLEVGTKEERKAKALEHISKIKAMMKSGNTEKN